MCGIAGAIGIIDPNLEEAVRVMSEAQAHRGPDQAGFFSSGPGPGIAFGFRRLAIIDLSPAGNQPMVDAARGNVVVFNGEIYNHLELRKELEGLGETFQGASDTEVLLKGYGRWGRDVLSRLRGMFAFAVFDPKRRTAFLARDRLGIKPLYTVELERPGARVLLFASELRALLATGLVERRLDPAAIASFVWNGFVVGPTTIVRGISLLSPGHSLTLSIERPEPRPERYWSLGELRTESKGDSRERLEAELATATRQHLMSDVPIGVFLSGGIDSSAVTALAVRTSPKRVQTFHVSFDEAEFDESKYASAVANALGTEHHEFRLTQEHFRASLDQAMLGMDQPTFDAINTYFVSRIVRDAGFTVALTGTGGDELFGGYRSFRDLPIAGRVSHAMRWLPDAAVAGMTRVVTQAASANDETVPPQTRWAKVGDVLRARGDKLAAYQVAYALFTRDFQSDLCRLDVNTLAPNGLPRERSPELRQTIRDQSALAAVSILELALFLGERLLRDSDAASMAVSLELRVPLLDHVVVEAACALSDEARFEPVGQKDVLRSLALPELPPALFQRPKAGFVLPIEVWARERLASDLQETFADQALVRSVGLEPGALQRLFNSFRAGASGMYWSRVWAPYALLRWCKTHRISLT